MRAIVAALFGILFPLSAYAYDVDLGPLGHACDTCGGGVVGGLPVIGHALNEAQAQALGAGLEQYFNASRNTAINGALPIPPNVRALLTGFSDQDAMNRVRYRIQDNGALNLAHIIQQWRLQDVTAVTLIDVIVFRGPSEASDVCLWAHELRHVVQFRDWGTHDFSIRYMRDNGSVENEAYAVQRDCNNRLAAGTLGAMQPILPQQPPFQPVPQQVGAFCITSVGRFGPGPLLQIGSPCAVGTLQGQIWGRIGF